MKISKAATKAHEKTVALVKSNHPLSIDERFEVAENWNPMAEHNVGKGGIFFTPMELAREVQMETFDKPGKRVLDLCAGTGRLALYSWAKMRDMGLDCGEIVCIDNNQTFVEVGKRILPEATWIWGDAFDERTYDGLGKFDEVISNPPYGLYPGKNGWLIKTESQYMAAEIAMKLAGHAVLIPRYMRTPGRARRSERRLFWFQKNILRKKTRRMGSRKKSRKKRFSGSRCQRQARSRSRWRCLVDDS